EDSDFRDDAEVLLEETGKRAEEDANARVVQAEGEIEKGNLSRNYARKIERYERLREELDRAGLRNTKSFETVVDDIRIWKASMADTWSLHCQDAAAARVEKNYEKAIASYRKSEGYGDEAIASQRHTLIVETEAERDREQDRARLDQQKNFEKMMKEFGEALGERRFDALAAIVKSREKMFTLDPYRKWLARVREDVQIFSALDQSARRGAEMLYAEKAEVGYKGEDRRGKFFRLTKVKEDRYTIRLSSGAETGESFSALVRGRLDLLNPFILNDPKLSEGQYFLVMGVLLLFDVNSSRTQLDRAGRMLEMAGSLGEDVERFGALSSWKRQEYDEREARQLLEKALESEERARSSKEYRKRLKPLAQARSAYEFLLKELSETQVVRDAREKIEKNLEGLDSLLPEPEEPEEPEKGAGRAPSLEELFAGRVIEEKGGRVRLEYDFKDESQFEKDWHSDPVGDGSFKWDEAGELYGVGVRRLYFKAPLKGDFKVEVQFEYGPEVGNFGLSFNNNLKRDTAHRSYLLITSVKAREDQPWWFRPMIGSHIGKHMLSSFNGGLPQIESKPDPVLRPKRKGRLVVSVQGDDVVVEINGKKVFGGRRNGPRDGSIGLVLLGGEVRVQEVKIEGTIRKDWLDK
ncbi:MAG: hypothetical protein QF752_01290, partial [Planctomycetota bacterium]|nr:hypothetical protein [Planctomycetota bacterium]